MKKTAIASLVGLALTSPIFAAENIDLNDIVVKSNRFEQLDTETTYASEIHTSKKIEASGAATLYDFLAQQTSLNLSPNIGNKATPSINLRGFGNENGYQNVVITIDGQRLNNIDMQPQLLGAIPLGTIDRIEISKGSGSVIYGDGATAGTLQIYTKNKTGITFSTSLGNFGQQNHYVNAGISEQYFDLSASVAHDSHDGFSKKDDTGFKDEFTDNTQSVKLKLKPTDSLKVILEGTSSRNDVRYVNYLTKNEFKEDPRQVTKRPFSQTYNHQSFDTDQWRVGAEYNIAENFQVSAFHFQEDKFSEYISAYPSTANSIYKNNELSVRYQDEVMSAIAGFQNFDGERKSKRSYGIVQDASSKVNMALFAQGDYRINNLTLSAGFRNEDVKYKFIPVGSSISKESNDINAWDVGSNFRITKEISLFANYNVAYQAPDIDRLYDMFGGGFNGFIKPAKAKTLNVGINHAINNNHLKVSAFRSNLKDEIYLDQTLGYFGTNSNADKTHKYGLEIQDHFILNNQFTASVIYNYTRAIVDKETTLNGTVVKDKDLPGVPKHTIIANLNYTVFENTALNLNHTWRAKAYAFNDFQNNFSQKQASYNSTNLAASYQYKNLNFFAAINNLFKQENSIQVADDAIYPVDFVRTWRVGVKADF